jgi:lysophospholipase L1-like esterase
MQMTDDPIPPDTPPANDTTVITPPPPPPPSGPPEQIDILALGDSYTKGESVLATRNFPNQLRDSLLAAGRKVTGLRIIAQTGWRTDQLKSAIANAAELSDSTFSIVTLCIGVNNQYQNGNFNTYKLEFEQLLQTAIARTGGRKERVFVISIPDWGYTPYGQGYPGGPTQISLKIDQYNAANYSIAQQYQVNYVNITGISRQGVSQPDLVATDGLHPSAEQYRQWVHLLMPAVQNVLGH